MLLTYRLKDIQKDRQTNAIENIVSLSEIIIYIPTYVIKDELLNVSIHIVLFLPSHSGWQHSMIYVMKHLYPLYLYYTLLINTSALMPCQPMFIVLSTVYLRPTTRMKIVMDIVMDTAIPWMLNWRADFPYEWAASRFPLRRSFRDSPEKGRKNRWTMDIPFMTQKF